MGKEARILVIDDDKGTADMLVEWLVKKGHRASAEYGGSDGIQAFERETFDLVITDLSMPEMDGMALLNAVKAVDHKVAVLMITGYGTVEYAVSAIKNGAYDFISKPLDFKVLDVTIDRALERRGLFRELAVFRRWTLALVVSVPIWLILGILLALSLQ